MVSTDRDALVALYNATGGADWESNTNWNTTAPLSQWFGVKVNDQDRVVELTLPSNNLKGPIPPDLGKLAALGWLNLSENQLSGPIPPELGKLAALKELYLYENQLSGSIPPELGKLAALQRLILSDNQITGPIPSELGHLSALKGLALYNNQLNGPIPPELGNLAALEILNLQVNGLSGPIPKELGALGRLEKLWLFNNNLTGAIPAQLGALNKLAWLDLSNNQLSGGPQQGETLDEWRRRLSAVSTTAPAGSFEPERMVGGGPQRGETLDERRRRLQKMDSLLRSELPSLPGLQRITQGNPDALGEVKSIIETSAGAGVHPGPVPSERDNLRELEGLVQKAYTLGKMVSKYTEEEDALGKELAPTPFQKAYIATVRSGLNESYLAASVINSRLVSTSKTGRMGKVGTVFKFLSRVVPFGGGLVRLAGALFTAGDRLVQNRLLAKITDMASDSNECCLLAKRVAEGLAGRVSHGTTTGGPVHSAAGMGGERGGFESNQNFGTSAVDTDENILEDFVERVANAEPTADGAGAGTTAEQDGRRRGKEHLNELLKGVTRGCLQGANNLGEKVERLIRIVFPDYVQTPVRTPAPAGSFEPERMVALWVALKKEMKTENETRQAELEELRASNAVLQRKVAALDKRRPEARRGFSGSTNAASLEARVAALEEWQQRKKKRNLRNLFGLR